MSLPFHASKFGKLSSGHRTGKGQFSFQSLRKAIPKNAQTTAQLHSSHTSKVMLKILQARLQQYVNHELPDVQLGFRKGRVTRDQIANIHWIIKKAREFQKNIYFCFIDYAKAFDSVDHNKLENSERDGNTRPPDLPLEKPVCMSGSNSKNWTWNNRLVPNRKRTMSRLYIVTLLVKLICRVHHKKRWAGRNTSWNQDCWEKYQ